MEPERIRIGELAEIAGVSTRAIRHYHRIGILPEPPRADNGYRRYSQVDAVALLRIRRLIELGMSLDEVADATSEDGDADLHEVLVELDETLARQSEIIAVRRARIAEVLDAGGGLRTSPDVAQLIAQWQEAAGPHPGAAREREIIELFAGTFGDATPAFLDGYTSLLADPAALGPALDAFRRFEEIAPLAPDDPVVDALIADILDLLPALSATIATPTPPPAAGGPSPSALAAVSAVRAGLSSSQQRVFDAVLRSIEAGQ